MDADEEDHMCTRNWIIFIIISFFAGGLVASIFFIRQNRRQSDRIAELERANADFERRYAEYNRQLSDVCNTIEDNNRRAGEIARAMAEQLANDSGNIEKTRTLVGLLREEIRVLESSYTSVSSIVHRDNNSNNEFSELKGGIDEYVTSP